MFGCNSLSVAQPNQTSLMNRPTRKQAAVAMKKSRRVIVLPPISWATTPKPHEHEQPQPLQSQIPPHSALLSTDGLDLRPHLDHRDRFPRR